MNDNRFLPKKGNYKILLSYQKSVIIYDCTSVFCERFLEKRDRTVDQMVQAARSGKQNIIEGSKAAVTSTETELKLTNVARASLEELLEDYNDYLRIRNFQLWAKNAREASYVRKLSSGKIEPPASLTAKVHSSHSSHESQGTNVPDSPADEQELIRQTFVAFLRTRPPEVCANIMICLIHQCNFLLDRQIKHLEENFTKEGGLRERMYKARIKYRNKQK
ncbi:four helix bundle suffix domain-containing protein [uncultured Desulfosarcina sp.]|uniref:four helix bundle suffix domain-containing protein n=1 Tax=uncultured Desulfosarcina sp. TaxID=218289 RepID=UPI0029C6C12F|nr:four helix bundle suffix domain-containing protein [uncultured Desulfosarcina sp.]